MADAIGAFQNDIDDLVDLEDIRYENIFKIYTKDKKYFYNILRKISISADANDMAYDTVKIQTDITWILLSYRVYKSIHLWWLIAIANNVFNPMEHIPGGTTLRIIKPTYVRLMLEEINDELSPIT
tara:strand:- start:13 stop:390 length:378 start_codon:yes stop_codon:yes gene_type:complete